MIYHQTRYTIRPDAPKDQVDHALEMLHRMGREIEVVQHFCVGRDFGGEFEYGALYAIKDIHDYKTYMYHPVHLATDRAGLPVVANMVSYDVTDDDDPTIGEQITQIHAERFAGDATLRGLVEGLNSYSGSGAPGSTIA